MTVTTADEASSFTVVLEIEELEREGANSLSGTFEEGKGEEGSEDEVNSGSGEADEEDKGSGSGDSVEVRGEVEEGVEEEVELLIMTMLFETTEEGGGEGEDTKDSEGTKSVVAAPKPDPPT